MYAFGDPVNLSDPNGHNHDNAPDDGFYPDPGDLGPAHAAATAGVDPAAGGLGMDDFDNLMDADREMRADAVNEVFGENDEGESNIPGNLGATAGGLLDAAANVAPPGLGRAALTGLGVVADAGASAAGHASDDKGFTARDGAELAGEIVGGILGAERGAVIGAAQGGRFGPKGATVGAVGGAVVGGITGGAIGREAFGRGFDAVADAFSF